MMAVDLHRARDLLLCSQFHQLEHGDSDNLSEEKYFFDPQKLWDFEFPSGFSPTALSSSADPESEPDSSETAETEHKDDCIAELTRRMAQYMFQENDDKHGFPTLTGPERMNESRDFGGWPSHTTQVWSPFGSSYGNPEGPLKEPTPPATPVIEKRHQAWDYSSFDQITGKLDEINIDDEQEGFKYRPSNQFQSLPTKPTSTPLLVENPTTGFRQNQALTLDQVRAIQFYKLKQELLLKQQQSYANKANQPFEQPQEHHHHNYLQFAKRNRSSASAGTRHPRAMANPQPQAGSGMRAVFLGDPGSKSGSCGTGVFLPCVIGETSQSRRKKGCSPVLIPAKVMQALKLHFDRMGNMSRQNATDFSLQNDTYNNNPGRNGTNSVQNIKQQSWAGPAMNKTEMGLPQDWTY